MSAVSETIVREFFELHGFFLRQHRKFQAPNREDDEQIDFFLVNPRPSPRGELPFELNIESLALIRQAVLLVRGWHSERFSAAVLANSPELFTCLEPGGGRWFRESFADEWPVHRILAVSALPQGREARAESIDFLRARGVDAVISFRTMLAGLINTVEINRNYVRSDLLQILRILKNYDFFAGPQLDLFAPRQRKPSRRRKTKPSNPSESDQH